MSRMVARWLQDDYAEFSGTTVVIDRDWWADDEPPSQEERDEWKMHENQDVLFDTGAYDEYAE